MSETTETLATRTRTAKRAMEQTKRRYYAKAASYEEMTAAAQAFCDAFAAYHLAKTGKRKRLDPRAVLR